ncbi:F-box/kelch-repeat protein At3g23880-like [Bidens hawaiensis]|uniref:F-box/kelch-repeat protein At3g23880-like n=1 Tax=Bidens hawaiensis TaxID=980011 RepID=UPI00404A406A
MAEVFHDDLVEQILILLDAKDLIRFKSVCKSWRSLITSYRFVNRHLNHSYHIDRYINENDRRISLVYDPYVRFELLGSSNGLVCFYDGCFKFYVGNPLTREAKLLRFPSPQILLPLCWGFGYDSSKDDYKVIIGAMNQDRRLLVHVLSMISNTWREIGEVKYICFYNRVGILCNGALHWIVRGENRNRLIISFDLSKEEYKEIPPPDDGRYEYASYLGIIKERLCISCGVDKWMMKDYNVKQSWELLPRNREMKYDIVHYTSAPYNFGNYPRLNCKTVNSAFQPVESCLTVPIFVQSLVSPFGNYRVKRKYKRRAS